MYTLLYDFKKFIQIIDNHDGGDTIDLKNYTFLGAATLLPLFAYARSNEISKYIFNSIKAMNYCKRVLNIEPHTNTTLPFEELPKHMSATDFADVAEKIRRKLLSKVYVEPQSFEFLVAEVLNNIYTHSKFEKAYILSQQYPNRKITDICIFDDGISIPGNFEEAGFDFEDDAEVIYGAINGKSTDIYNNGFSGRGLNTSTQIATIGFQEDMLIASREGLCYITNKGAKIYIMDEKYIKGTYVAIRINENKLARSFNIYTGKIKKIKKISKQIL